MRPDYKLDGENYLKWFESSDEAERGFCTNCGSHLFFRLKEGLGDYRGVSSGSLDDESGLKIDKHIFIDKKPEYYDFKDNSPRLTEREFLAQFGEE